MLTIYQKGGAFRVVQGEHKPCSDSMKNATARCYADASEAFETETDSRIREAIALIDPSVKAIPAARLHHKVPATHNAARNAGANAYARGEQPPAEFISERYREGFVTGWRAMQAERRAQVLEGCHAADCRCLACYELARNGHKRVAGVHS